MYDRLKAVMDSKLSIESVQSWLILSRLFMTSHTSYFTRRYTSDVTSNMSDTGGGLRYLDLSDFLAPLEPLVNPLSYIGPPR